VAAGQAGRVGQAVQERADLQGLAAGGEQGAGGVQVAAQGRVVGVDAVNLVDQQQAARGELGRPGGQGRRRVGEVAEQQAAGEQVGRRAWQRGPGHVVDGELDPRWRVRGGQGDERRRLVEAEDAARRQGRGQQAGGVPGAAAQVDGQAGPAAGEAGQERAAGRLEEVGQHAEAPRRRRGVAEGIAAHGGDGGPWEPVSGTTRRRRRSRRRWGCRS
jgi:hypothetical protein